MSIRARLLALLLPGLVLVLVIGGGAVYWIARASLMRQMDSALEARVHTLASLVKLEPGGLAFEISDASPAMLEQTWFELRDDAGDVLQHSSNFGRMSLPRRQPDENVIVFSDAVLAHAMHGRAAWLAFQPRVDADDWEGHDAQPAALPRLIMAAAIDRQPLDSALATLRGTLLTVGAVVSILAIVLATIGVRWGLSPLHRLRRQLATVDGETAGQRLDAREAPRELGPVYRELNGMLERVAQTIERERTFADAAAHELRTPLSELRSTAEVALRWPDVKPASASLNDVLAIGGEMERLVESLLLIGRRNGHEPPAARGGRFAGRGFDEVLLAPLVQRSLNHHRARMTQKGLRISVDVDNVALAAQAQTLEIIMRNLIDNATQYTRPGGSIVIRTEQHSDRSARLIFENGPVDLAASDLPRIFEPFWRADQAHTSREHVGLGLAVVQRAAQASGLGVHAALIGDRLQIQIRPSA